MFTKTTKFLALGALGALLIGTAAIAQPFVYIPVGGAGQIQVVDAASGQIVDTYDGLTAVHGLAGTPDRKYLIAGSYTERDRGSAAPAKPAGMSDDEHAAHHTAAPAGTVQSDQVSTVTILRQDTGEVVRSVDVPGAVHHVTTSPDGRFAAVTHPAYDSISVIDLQSFGVRTIKTGSLPNYMVFSPDSGTLYVSNAGDNSIATINTTHWMTGNSFATGESPEHMVLSPDGKTLFVNNTDGGTVNAIDTTSGQTTAIYPIGERLHGLDITDDGTALLVAERDGNNVARVDLASGTVSKQAMGPEPYHLTTITGTGLAYVSSSDEPVMRIIDQNDMSLKARIDINDIGHQMVVSPTR